MAFYQPLPLSVVPTLSKSTLLNRIAGERISIVEDVEGVTVTVFTLWRLNGWSRKFSMMDTGGINDVDAPFMEQIKHQAEIAMDESDVIVFSRVWKRRYYRCGWIRGSYATRIHKPIILVVNKVDNPEMRNEILIFMRWA